MDNEKRTAVQYGRFIKNIRAKKGYSQEELCEEMGWTKSTLSKIENNRRAVSVEELYRIACILNEPLTSFFPELVVEVDEEYMTSFEGVADDIARLYLEIEEAGGKIEGETMDRVVELFQRTIPQHLYRLLNISSSKVQIRGTVMRGPHFIPRVEIYLLDQHGEPIPWFYLALIFKDNLKHTYLSLSQSDDIKFRAEADPVDQDVQLAAIRDRASFYLSLKGNAAWKAIMNTGDDIFLDENGLPPEKGTIISTGYIPLTPPDEWDAWTGTGFADYVKPFLADNVDGFTYTEKGDVAKYIISYARDNEDMPGEEYKLYTELDEDVLQMFDMLQSLVKEVQDSSFVNWKSAELGMTANSVEKEFDRLIKEMLEKNDYYSEVAVKRTVNDILERYENWKPATSIVGTQDLKKAVLEKRGYQCEVDAEHASFIDRQSGKPYLETAHIIPLSAQPDFKKDLNNTANMVCLCPNCHRKLDYGTEDETEEMLVNLYYAHRDELKMVGIDISLRQLLQYYSRR